MKKRLLHFIKWYQGSPQATLFGESKEQMIDRYIDMLNNGNGEIIEMILNDLTARRGCRRLKTTKHREKLIIGLIDQGYEVEDFFEVNRYMVDKWGNDYKMREYLTPETLYQPSKFTKYLEMIENEPEHRDERIKRITRQLV